MSHLASRLDEIATNLLQRGYEVLRLVGSGRYALAFELESHQYPEHFCAKVIDNSASQSGIGQYVYEAEVECLLSLTHPNIITVFDMFELEDLRYLILEFAEGGSLKEKFKEQTVIPSAELAVMGRQIIDALAYCHGQGIAHGDIKPANVLLDRYKRPKVADFGFGTRYGPQASLKKCGTPSYMSPELLSGRAKDPFACDVWALGVMLYELVTGTRPFVSDRKRELLKEIAMTRVEVPKSVHPGLAEAIINMLSFDPRVRPTMAKLLELPCFSALKMRPTVTTPSIRRLFSSSRPAQPTKTPVRCKRSKHAQSSANVELTFS
jgi:serine/threonine protein kinase